MKKSILASFTVLLFFSTGCYSWKGIAIPPDISSFYVENFENTSPTAPADINQRFSESLRAKIRNESRLVNQETNPDITFSGSIAGFNLRPEAPQAGNTVALNRLDIIVNVVYTNNKNEKDSWKQTFSFYKTYASDQDFISIQDDMIIDIFKQLMEDIFNKAFTGW